jgi:type II secretory pathway pseudopilin PulG
MKLSRSFRPHHRSGRNAERGYILLTLILFVALLAISYLAMLPEITRQIKRDREEELIHRGVQYSRAIKHFVKKFGRYPTRIEELEDTNNLRFLRKRYKDPITGKDFKILHMGDVQMGLMGGIGAMPGSAAAAVAAQSGAFGNANAFGGNTLGGNNSAFGGNSFGSNNGGFGGNAFGNSGSAFGGNNSAFGGNSSTFGASNNAFGNSSFGGSNSMGSAFGSGNGSAGNANGGIGATAAATPGTDSTQANGSNPDQTASGSQGTQPGSGQSGAIQVAPGQVDRIEPQGNVVFGGGPMVGVASTSKDKTIRVFNKKEHYNDWQFIYDPSTDRGGLLMTPNQPGLQSVSAVNPTQGAPGSQGNSLDGSQNSSSGWRSNFGLSGGQQPFGSTQQPSQPQSSQPQQPQFPPEQGP